MEVRALLWGIDKLEGSFEVDGYMEQAAGLLRDLMSLRVQAQQERVPQPYQIGGRQFLVGPKGRKFYEISLSHADMIIWLTDYEKAGTPPVLVSISSEYLWAVGPVKAVKEVYKTLRLAGLEPTSDKCSRVDLMLDYTGRPLKFPDIYDIVCTSRKRLPLDGQFLAQDEYLGNVGQKHREFGTPVEQGLDIRQYAVQKGRTPEMTGIVVALGQPLSWRGYNKLLEIERVSGKWWFLDIWRKNGWAADPETGEMPVVWRSEFQLRREIIADLEPVLGARLDSFKEVIDQAPALWRYLTGEWLTFKNRRADKCVTRCSLRRWWQVIQRPDVGLDWNTIDPVERLGNLRKAKRKVLDDMIAGCLAGIAAHQGTEESLVATAETWADELEKTVAKGDLEQFRQDWGLKARKRMMQYLLADLRDRMKEALVQPGAGVPDVVRVVRSWQQQLNEEAHDRFADRALIKQGQLNHGKGLPTHAEGCSDWTAD